MIPELATGFAAASNAIKIAGGLLKINQDINIQRPVIKLQSSIIELQTQLSEFNLKYEQLCNEKKQIEEKLLAYDSWEKESENYELKQLSPGIYVRALKKDVSKEPLHYICPYCYEKRKKSILCKPSADSINYKCFQCSFDIIPTQVNYPSSMYDEPTYGGGLY